MGKKKKGPWWPGHFSNFFWPETILFFFQGLLCFFKSNHKVKIIIEKYLISFFQEKQQHHSVPVHTSHMAREWVARLLSGNYCILLRNFRNSYTLCDIWGYQSTAAGHWGELWVWGWGRWAHIYGWWETGHRLPQVYAGWCYIQNSGHLYGVPSWWDKHLLSLCVEIGDSNWVMAY